jgi:tRNA-splicing ligase RtcB (3'-phosphate/5'-hydroxy nucleic acid ligase)
VERINAKLLSWASLLEDQARDQAMETAALPFVKPHVALMPDAHYGLGATVGSVIPTIGAVIPAAVGVDIGCGMTAGLTTLTRDDLPNLPPLAQLRTLIEQQVPVSMGKYRAQLSGTSQQRVWGLEHRAARDNVNPDQFDRNWRMQLGSLGSGNHFIEVCHDELARVWVFLHSGSRGIGNRIARHHIKVAQQLCDRWFIDLPNKDLAYLPQHDDAFWSYIRDLLWAQAFARENRDEMRDRIVDCMTEWAGRDVTLVDTITCHHNYTEQEHHMGRDVWVTRKGAISAQAGQRGLIPGSMGRCSYVVTGRGHSPSFHSAPHGAGRLMSRTKARERVAVGTLVDAMAGIEWRSEIAEQLLDEAPEAYKPIDQIMVDAAELVTVDHTLTQILNVKGT